MFVDISKAFDIIIKFKQNRISGKLLRLIKDFLSNRKQHVVLNGQFSFWMDVQAGILVRSILGHLLFLIYINDLLDNLTSNSKLFADDTLTDPNVTANQINNDLHNINTQEVILAINLRLLFILNLFSTIIQHMKPQLKSILESSLISN